MQGKREGFTKADNLFEKVGNKVPQDLNSMSWHLRFQCLTALGIGRAICALSMGQISVCTSSSKVGGIKEEEANGSG